jgi:hypothetical protein
VVIEQAKGVISERAGVDLAGALSWLRAWACSHNRRLTDVARAAVDGTLDPRARAAHRPPGAILTAAASSGGPPARNGAGWRH